MGRRVEAHGSGRVGSDFLSEIADRVGSGQRFDGSGRVQEKWPVDNIVANISWKFQAGIWNLNINFQK